MTYRKWKFVFIFLTYLIVSSSFAKNKPQSAVFNSATYTSDKPRQPMDKPLTSTTGVLEALIEKF